MGNRKKDIFTEQNNNEGKKWNNITSSQRNKFKANPRSGIMNLHQMECVSCYYRLTESIAYYVLCGMNIFFTVVITLQLVRKQRLFKSICVPDIFGFLFCWVGNITFLHYVTLFLRCCILPLQTFHPITDLASICCCFIRWQWWLTHGWREATDNWWQWIGSLNNVLPKMKRILDTAWHLQSPCIRILLIYTLIMRFNTIFKNKQVINSECIFFIYTWHLGNWQQNS